MIADGHEMVRESIAVRVEANCDARVISAVGDGYSALQQFRQLKPELLILDLELQPDGRDVLVKVIAMSPETRVIATTSDPTLSIAYYALSRGAMAFLPKQVSSAEFVNAVNAVIGGFSYLPRDVMNEFIHSRRNLTRVGNVFGLSPREMEIVKACANGLTTKDVAAELGISVRTVETHKHNIYRKTNCKNQKELIDVASSL